MSHIHAELTAPAAGRQEIILVAGGTDVVAHAEAARRIAQLTPLFKKSNPPGALTVPATWPAVIQLAHTFGPYWSPGPRLVDWIREQTLARTAVEHTPLSYVPPEPLVPFAWQRSGAAMIAATGGALITDEPGTGKTVTAILGLVEWGVGPHTAGQGGDTVLVVCPSSVIDHWVAAWSAWAPHLRAVAWRGTPKQRSAMVGTADVYVVGYETARQDAPPASKHSRLAPLVELEPAALVIDECHLIKNHTSARSQAVRRLAKKAECVVALSGTPITHHPGDLWASLDAISHDAWPARERWVRRYCNVLEGDNRDLILGLAEHAEPEFRLTLLGQFRRVAKADVLAELPPKRHSVRTVDLPVEWRKAYDEFEGQMIAELPDNGGELAVMDVLAKLAHLTALASAPADVEITFGPDVDDLGMPKQHIHLELKPSSWKVTELIEIMAERQVDVAGHPDLVRCEPIVAFAPSKQLIELAGQAAAAAGYRVGYVMGGQKPADRTAAVVAFQAGELDLICVTTGAGGVGLTLTAARTCVFLQRPWSLVEAMQAEDRCHRIGSERHDSIEVIDIVARNTIDTRVRAVLRERAGQLSDLVQDPRVASELLGGTSSITTERKAS